MKTFLFLLLSSILLTSCWENYSNGERIGTINQFSQTGKFYKTWEGHLNMTQTGMTSSTNGFDFSIDGDKEDQALVHTLDSAANNGWKVKLKYHEVGGLSNFWGTRGHTNHFVTECDVLDRNFSNDRGYGMRPTDTSGGGKDTIFVVIVPKSALKDGVKL